MELMIVTLPTWIVQFAQFVLQGSYPWHHSASWSYGLADFQVQGSCLNRQ